MTASSETSPERELPPHVHLAFTPTEATRTFLDGQGWSATWYADGGVEPRESLLHSVEGAAALVTVLTQRVDEELLARAGDELRIVANMAAGFDNLDLDALARRRILGTNCPRVLDGATADLAMALVLATARRVVEADRYIRTGVDWSWRQDLFVGPDLSAGRTLGIVGLGSIGTAVARRARAFDMEVIATGRRARGAEAQHLGVQSVELPDLLRRADVVSLHCPLVPQTRHLIGVPQFAAMKEDAILVNTARGPIVDEDALVTALREGQIGAAGLDVFEDEPRIHPGLLELDNVVLLPHIGSAGDRTRQNLADRALENVTAALAGESPRDLIAPPA